MAITLSNKGRVAIKQQAAWGTPETSFAATDYLEVEAPFIPVLAREAIKASVYQPGYTESETVAGSKSPTELTFRMPLHGWSTSTPSADPTIHPDALLFKLALGDAAASASGYNTANLGAGSPADEQTTYTNGSITAFVPGYAVSYPTAGLRTVAWADDKNDVGDPDVVGFIAATARDVASGTAYGSFVAWLSNTAQLPATFDWYGSDSNAHIRYSDGLPTSVRLIVANKTQPMVEVTMREHMAANTMFVLLKPRDIWGNIVDPRIISTRKQKAHVDNDDIVVELNGRHVFADTHFANSTDWDDLEGWAGRPRPFWLVDKAKLLAAIAVINRFVDWYIDHMLACLHIDIVTGTSLGPKHLSLAGGCRIEHAIV